MKTEYGEVIELVWPEGNDDGELFVRGHVPFNEAREELLGASGGLEDLAVQSLEGEDEAEDYSDAVYQRMTELLDGARFEHRFARWSQESNPEFDEAGSVLRDYRSRGRGRFSVTKVTLWPRPPCALSRYVDDNVYRCMSCKRRFVGEQKKRGMHGGPSDCERLVGDEVGPFITVIQELEQEAAS